MYRSFISPRGVTIGRRFILILLTVLLFAGQSVWSNPSYNNPKIGKKKLFLFKIEKFGQVSYLVGAIHVLPLSSFPLAPEFRKALDKSDELVVEVDISGAKQSGAQKTMVQSAVLPNNTEVKDILSKKSYDILSQKFKGMGMSLKPFRKYKPWFIALMMPQLQLKLGGKKYKPGVDMYFLVRAKIKKKPVIELESVLDQLALFNGMTYEEQEAFLISAIGKGNKSNLGMLVDVWESGDPVIMDLKLNTIIKAEPKLKKFYYRMFEKRNIEMFNKIEKLMEQKDKVYCIVVGAGHLVGSKGIIRSLKEKGFRVTQIYSE